MAAFFLLCQDGWVAGLRSGQRRFRVAYAGLDGLFPIQVRDWRAGCGFEELQGVLGALQIREADSAGGHLRHEALAIGRVSGGKLLVLTESKVKVLQVLSGAAEVKPKIGRYLLCAAIAYFLVALPGQIPFPRLQGAAHRA